MLLKRFSKATLHPELIFRVSNSHFLVAWKVACKKLCSLLPHSTTETVFNVSVSSTRLQLRHIFTVKKCRTPHEPSTPSPLQTCMSQIQLWTIFLIDNLVYELLENVKNCTFGIWEWNVKLLNDCNCTVFLNIKMSYTASAPMQHPWC